LIELAVAYRLDATPDDWGAVTALWLSRNESFAFQALTHYQAGAWLFAPSPLAINKARRLINGR
jgi:hypothetical protein